MTLVERAARALCRQGEQDGGPPWDWYDEAGRERFRVRARAVLEAIREPITEGFVANMPPEARYPAEYAADLIFDAALSEGA